MKVSCHSDISKEVCAIIIPFSEYNKKTTDIQTHIH